MCFQSLCKRKKEVPLKWDDTIKFVPPITEGVCIKVYDGDTITIAAKLPYKNSPMYRFNIRLRSIDAPELHGPKKEDAKKSQEELSLLVLHHTVKLSNIDIEKYGRVLADVYIDNINLSHYMLSKNLAEPYNGGKKT